MKTEVLKSIKEAENEYKAAIAAADEDKKRSISDARQEAENLILKAQKDAEEYKSKRIADARKEAAVKYEEILTEGKKRADDIKRSASSNQDTAVESIVSQFKVKLNV